MTVSRTTSRWIDGALDILASGALATGVVGLVLRYAIRDRIVALAPAFYALPPLVVVILFALSFGLSLRRGQRRRRATICGILTMVAVGVWIQTDGVWARGVDGNGDSLRVVLWNLSRPSPSDVSFIPVLKETNAQIFFLVESGGDGATRRHFWESHFPDYHVCLLRGEIVLLSAYPIASVGSIAMGGGATRIAEYDLATPTGELSVVGADVAAVPYAWRQRPVSTIHKIAGSKSCPVIVLGDFNTPHTSIFFDDFRPSFRHAFEESGVGLITTWPSLLPVLALDHIWLSGDLRAERTILRRTWYSDHAMVIADVSIDKTDEPKGPDSSI